MQKTKKGYVLVHMPGHPRADKYGRVFEHIVVWEQANHSTVPKGYVIHHLNGIKDDNRPENLKRLTISEHSILHNSLRKFTDETKKKISDKLKASYKSGRKPTIYKDIDMSLVINDLKSGLKRLEICKKYNIGRSTLYKKLKREGYYESCISYR